ncbi:TerC family protein [Chitinimonas sp. BJYL2]|uniref:TerC family protein n=1 Tax=Chitinimonas sp. BJYL2 TaxID=2976696 RepID=UPI0022B50C5B|nr:TerC family protein [Chitinimonas sp. BJYL2]
MEIWMALWLGKPIWMWVAFLAVVLALLVFDLGVLNRKDEEIGAVKSLKLSAFYIAAGLAFGAWVWLTLGADAGMQYYTGFLIEKSLSLDNVFVISLIFTYFAVPRRYQHRVLFWGILGVIVLRAIMIALGATLVAQYYWTLYLFGGFLILTGLKMLFVSDSEPDLSRNPILRLLHNRLRVTDQLHEQRFFVRQPAADGSGPMVWWATPLFLALCMVELVDLVFAVDSVPAIFAITTDPFLVYTSNIFAILGLRALYFALAAIIHRFHYLKYALALVLVFIGSKIFLGDFVFDGKVPATLSLAITFGLLAAGVLYSLWKTRDGGVVAAASK